MFKDRRDAGWRLARVLEKYRNAGVVVLAIPRGGVEVGYQVAAYLNAGFSVLVSRKLPYPDNPEAGFGAVAEDGSTFLLDQAKAWLSEETVEQIVEQQKQEIHRRVQVLRGGRPLPSIYGETVILVDDGIAMGSTMRASVQMCFNQGAGKIVVAAPVSGRDVKERLGDMADEIVVLEQPVFFQAVAQVYRNWYDVSDDEVIEILHRWEEQAGG